MTKLVVHVPHASIAIPDDIWPEFLIDPDRANQEAMVSADLYTELMAREAWPNAEIIEAPVSRIVVDVERYEDDAFEEMASVGRGVIYTHDHMQERIRKDPSFETRVDLLARYYTPHWSRLRAAAIGATLIDLHTYPTEVWPIGGHAGGRRPEIDLGFTDGLTPKPWILALSQHFSDAGYEVGHNTPYAGVIDAGASAAVMIEIRRDIVGAPGDRNKWQRLMRVLKALPLDS